MPVLDYMNLHQNRREVEGMERREQARFRFLTATNKTETIFKLKEAESFLRNEAILKSEKK